MATAPIFLVHLRRFVYMLLLLACVNFAGCLHVSANITRRLHLLCQQDARAISCTARKQKKSTNSKSKKVWWIRPNWNWKLFFTKKMVSTCCCWKHSYLFACLCVCEKCIIKSKWNCRWKLLIKKFMLSKLQIFDK